MILSDLPLSVLSLTVTRSDITVPLKGKLTVPRNSILDSRKLKARVEFPDVRGRSRIYRVEFRDFRVEKKRTFCAINF